MRKGWVVLGLALMWLVMAGVVLAEGAWNWEVGAGLSPSAGCGPGGPFCRVVGSGDLRLLSDSDSGEYTACITGTGYFEISNIGGVLTGTLAGGEWEVEAFSLAPVWVTGTITGSAGVNLGMRCQECCDWEWHDVGASLPGNWTDPEFTVATSGCGFRDLTCDVWYATASGYHSIKSVHANTGQSIEIYGYNSGCVNTLHVSGYTDTPAGIFGTRDGCQGGGTEMDCVLSQADTRFTVIGQENYHDASVFAGTGTWLNVQCPILPALVPTATVPIETPTPTPTPSPTPTFTPWPTATLTPVPTLGPSPTPTFTPWPTATLTSTPPPGATLTPTPTPWGQTPTPTPYIPVVLKPDRPPAQGGCVDLDYAPFVRVSSELYDIGCLGPVEVFGNSFGVCFDYCWLKSLDVFGSAPGFGQVEDAGDGMISLPLGLLGAVFVTLFVIGLVVRR